MSLKLKKAKPATKPLEPYFADEAKKRMATSGPGVYGGKPGKGQCTTPGIQSRDQAARAVGISGKTLSVAKAIKEKSPGS